MELFRQQAVDSFLQSSDGKVLQIRKLPYRKFSLFIVIFLIFLFAFLRWVTAVPQTFMRTASEFERGAEVGQAGHL